METLTYNEAETESAFWDLARRALQITDEQQTEVLNKWQQLSEATGTVVTPANALDAVAFAGAMYGIYNFDSWKGIAIAAASFSADIVDGKIARATKTQSPLGEAIDASGDKVKMAFALYQMWKLDLAPKSLITAVAIQNGANIALTAADRALNTKPAIHPSQYGKKATFLQQMGMGMHVIGSEVAKTNQRRANYIKRLGTALTVAGLGLGGAATAGYTTTFLASRKTHAKK